MKPPARSPEFRAEVARLIAHYELTPAMAEVALGIWYGKSEKQIATWLGKAKGTVHEHLRRLYRDSRWPAMKCRVSVAIAVERVLSVPPG